MGLLHNVVNNKHAILSNRTNKRFNKIPQFYYKLIKTLISYLVLLTLNPFSRGKSLQVTGANNVLCVIILTNSKQGIPYLSVKIDDRSFKTLTCKYYKFLIL